MIGFKKGKRIAAVEKKSDHFGLWSQNEGELVARPGVESQKRTQAVMLPTLSRFHELAPDLATRCLDLIAMVPKLFEGSRDGHHLMFTALSDKL